MRFHTDGIHARIRANVAGHVFEKLDHVVHLLIVDDLCSRLLRTLETILKAVNGNHAFSTEHKCALDGKLTHGTTAPDGDCVSGLYVAVFRTHIAGGKNVREEHDFLIGNSGGNL